MTQRPKSMINIDGKSIGLDSSTYFIADVAANHDGDIERAKDLVYLAAEAGADAAKFQHFSAETIVSDEGFKNLGSQQSHQGKWKKSVFDVYKDASIDPNWTPTLKETCDKAGITFFTSPYSFDLIDEVDQYVPAYKVGSGDITWLQIIRRMAKKGKPMLIASGAATCDEVRVAVEEILQVTSDVVLMQCNTNYTGSLDNFKHIQLNVLKTYAVMFPGMILGLSDHTSGHATVLGAIALGARVIEKHFTDDTSRVGPDHGFSMDPQAWREMVNCTRELEYALGDGIKKVEVNEKETVILQRRSIRASRAILAGEKLSSDNVEVLRPCPVDGIPPYEIENVYSKQALRNIKKGDHIRWNEIE